MWIWVVRYEIGRRQKLISVGMNCRMRRKYLLLQAVNSFSPLGRHDCVSQHIRCHLISKFTVNLLPLRALKTAENIWAILITQLSIHLAFLFVYFSKNLECYWDLNTLLMSVIGKTPLALWQPISFVASKYGFSVSYCFQ